MEKNLLRELSKEQLIEIIIETDQAINNRVLQLDLMQLEMQTYQAAGGFFSFLNPLLRPPIDGIMYGMINDIRNIVESKYKNIKPEYYQ